MIRLLDIEGTVCPLSFVRDTLFPYARAALPGFVETHRDDPQVAGWLAEAAREAGVDDHRAVVDALIAWSDQDRKVTPLKALQGRIWRAGWEAGAFVAPLYPDVVPALRRWRAAGDRLAVFSSGSVEAQQLLFAHTDQGDLAGWFERFFDTTTGPKKEPVAYVRIAAALEVTPGDVVFYSDLSDEIEAARSAGMQARHVMRDGVPGTDRIATFDRE